MKSPRPLRRAYCLLGLCVPLFALLWAPPARAQSSTSCLFANVFQYADTQPAQAPNGDMRYLAEEVRCLVNFERQRNGLPALPSAASLRSLAVAYAQDEVKRHYFSHTSPGGSTIQSRFNSVGYKQQPGRTYCIGENLAYGSGTSGTPRTVITTWMNSPYHRANILSSCFAEIGVGAALGTPANSADRNGANYVAEFGRR